MEKLKIYYGIQNGGDGSAYPTLFESMELAEWDQDHMDEGWGERCTGFFEFESESPIICKEEILTKEYYLILEYLASYKFSEKHSEREDYLEEFFPNGLPNKITTRIEVFEEEDFDYVHFSIEGQAEYLGICKTFDIPKLNNYISSL